MTNYDLKESAIRNVFEAEHEQLPAEQKDLMSFCDALCRHHGPHLLHQMPHQNFTTSPVGLTNIPSCPSIQSEDLQIEHLQLKIVIE